MLKTEPAAVIVPIPADLAARIETLKKNRAEDRERSLEELVLEMCRRYVRIREMAVEDSKHAELLEENYRLHPADFPDDWSSKENNSGEK